MTGQYAGETGALISYASSFLSKDAGLQSFVSSKATPAAVMNVIGGFPAEILMQAELKHMPAVVLVTITDAHDVNSETLQGFKPVFNDLLGFKIDFDALHTYPEFKAVLKEKNNKKHNIFN